MGLDQEWVKKVEESLLQEEEQKEERKYQIKLRSKNDQI